MNPASVEDALYELGNQMGAVATEIRNHADTGFTFKEEVVLRAVQGICSREDFTGINPAFIADYALQVAESVAKRLDASDTVRKDWKHQP